MVAIASALRPDQAAVARAVLLAGVADIEDQPVRAVDDAAAAGVLAAILDALAALPLSLTPMRPDP